MDNIKPCGLNKKSTKCNTATLAGASAHQIDTKNKLGGKRLSDLHQIMCLLLSSVLSWTWTAAAAVGAFIYCTNCTTSLHYYPATCGCCCCCNNMLSFPRMKGSRVVGRCKLCCVICHRQTTGALYGCNGKCQCIKSCIPGAMGQSLVKSSSGAIIVCP